MTTESSLPQIDEEGNDFNHKKSEKIIKSDEEKNYNIGFGGRFQKGLGIITENYEGSFEEIFRGRILKNDFFGKSKDADFFSPFIFSSEVRDAAHCIGLDWLVYDIDKRASGEDGVSEDVYERIINSNIRGLRYGFYKSKSSKKGAIKFRLVFPLKNRVDLTKDDADLYAEAYHLFWMDVLCGEDGDDSADIESCRAFREVNYDINCNHIAQMFYTPRIPDSGDIYEEDFGDFLDFSKYLKEAKEEYLNKNESERKNRKHLKNDFISHSGYEKLEKSKYDFVFREKGLVASFDKILSENAYVGNRNKTINDFFFYQIPIIRQRYFYENELEEVFDKLVDVAFDKTYDPSIDKCPRNYRTEIERTLRSAKKATQGDFGRDFNELSDPEKDIFNFFFNSSALHHKIVKSKDDTILMSRFAKECIAKNFVIIEGRVFVRSAKTNYWEPITEYFNEIGNTVEAEELKIKDLATKALEVKEKIMDYRLNDERAAVLELNPNYDKDVKSGKAFDEQYETFKEKHAYYNRFKDLFWASTVQSKNIKLVTTKINVEKPVGKELVFWQDHKLPHKSEPEKIVLPFKNGRVIRYDKTNHKFFLDSAKPEEYIRKSFTLDIDDFDPSVRYKNDLWDKYINEVFAFEEDKLWLQRFLGSSLVMDGATHEKLTFLYGPTANGKSVLLEGIMATLFGPSFVDSISRGIFEGGGSGSSPEIMEMNQARIGLISEFSDEKSKVVTAAAKTIISKDGQKARNHYEKKLTTMRKKGIVICSANYNKLPPFDKNDEAIWRRMVLIEMPFIYVLKDAIEFNPEKHRERDDLLSEKILKIEKRAVLQWFLDGALSFIELGPGSVVNTSRNSQELVLKERNSSGDVLRYLLEKYIVPVDDDFLASDKGKYKKNCNIPISSLLSDCSQIREKYPKWGASGSEASFVKELRNAGFVLERTKGEQRPPCFGGRIVEKKSLTQSLCISGYRWVDSEIS